MRAYNLISVFQAQEMMNLIEEVVPDGYNLLKKHEADSLHKFCDTMKSEGCSMKDLDGYFVGYTIKQIGKEFDLLRFGNNYILNIELKQSQDKGKILTQMRKNYYYLELLGSPIKIFTCLDSGEIYEYERDNDSIKAVSAKIIANYIKLNEVDREFDPDKAFVPANYLISPFNSPERFINDEYFLTDAQNKIKTNINNLFTGAEFAIFCVSANAGTGKTLLTYDIAKEYMKQGNKTTVIHCGVMNDGQKCLVHDYGWDIVAIRDINIVSIDRIINGSKILIVDEAQRIWGSQLKLIIERAKDASIPIIFSYDIKQYMRQGEGKNIFEYVKTNYPDISLESGNLKNKIRTNKELASFVKNMFNVGSSNGYMNYDCVTVDYIDTYEELKEYIELLRDEGWMVATYTVSQYNTDSNDEISSIVDKTAHGVIGQEFPKVVAIMNNSFKYDENGKLVSRKNYYSSYGMLYQIVTRVVNDLKIVVYKNPDVYLKLLEIKAMGKSE